ncbi:biotin carboxylase [Streptomyces sp. BK340]|nr:biotin carboxylase [Streptomyces sp. BK340]
MPELLMLLGAGSVAAGAECLLTGIAATHPVVLVDATAPAWAKPYLVKHIAANLTECTITAGVVENYASRHEVRGVLTYMPEHLVTAAHVADRLELPSAPAASLATLTDLVALRELLARHQVPQPRWAEAVDAEAAIAYADLLGYPVLVRPRTNVETGVALAHSQQGVLDARERLIRDSRSVTSSPVREMVVEEYPDGPSISVETVVLGDGEIRMVAIARTTFSPTPNHQAIRYCVDAHDGLLHNPVLRQIVTLAVRAIGVAPGVLHITMKLSPRGPLITDIQGRLAHDLVPALVKRATGIDLPQIAARLAAGKSPDLTPTRQRAAAIHFAYSSTTGRIQNFAVPLGASHRPFLERMVLLQQIGNHVVAMPEARPDDRLAYWVVLGRDASDCNAMLDEASLSLSTEIAESSVTDQAALQRISPATRFI